jgi:hypothetical protein
MGCVRVGGGQLIVNQGQEFALRARKLVLQVSKKQGNKEQGVASKKAGNKEQGVALTRVMSDV